MNINQYLVSWTTALIRGELDCTALIPGELGLLRSYLVSWTAFSDDDISRQTTHSDTVGIH